MGATPTYGLPYPELDDPDNVPTDMHELADAVEAKLAAEAGARQAVDGRVTAEATARTNADNAEAGARAAADNALAARTGALEAAPRPLAGFTTVDFVDGAGRLNYPAPVGATIGAVVTNADGRTANAWFGVIGVDAAGLNLYAWNSAGNVPLTTAAVRIAWVAVVQ